MTNTSSKFTFPMFLTFVVYMVIAMSILIYFRLTTVGDIGVVYCVLCMFLLVNLSNCYWEMSLATNSRYIEERAKYWKDWQGETGRTPARGFFLKRVTLLQAISPLAWADMWAAYSYYDEAYADRKSYAFIVDTGNGFVSLLPSLFLLTAFTIEWPGALITGLISAMLFWQLVYMTSLYFTSYFVSGGNPKLTRFEFWMFVVFMNGIWIVVPIFGLYIAIRMVFEGNYSALLF